MKKVTAGRDYLGNIAPQFAHLNDDVLFGEVWAKDDVLTPKQRSMITISSLIGAGILDESLKGHLETGKQNGITKKEIVELITHLSFYCGWPKAWAAFAMAGEIYQDDTKNVDPLFGRGDLLNDQDHFSGNVYVKEYFGFDRPMLVDNVTFEPGSYNNWHIHKAGQTLFVLSGNGWYQEEGKEAQYLKAGDVVDIPADTKHWHGACKDSWFTHLIFEDHSKGAPVWLDRLPKEEYERLQEK